MLQSAYPGAVSQNQIIAKTNRSLRVSPRIARTHVGES